MSARVVDGQESSLRVDTQLASAYHHVAAGERGVIEESFAILVRRGLMSRYQSLEPPEQTRLDAAGDRGRLPLRQLQALAGNS